MTNRDLDRHQPTDERLRRSKDEGRDRQQHHATEVQPGPVVGIEAPRLAPASNATATSTETRPGIPLGITGPHDRRRGDPRADFPSSAQVRENTTFRTAARVVRSWPGLRPLRRALTN